jgi:toxin FitB
MNATRQADRLTAWLRTIVIPAFGQRMLASDVTVALACAPLQMPDPRPERDAVIAATALVHNLTLATRNTRDFEPMGVKLLNPRTTP